MHSDSENEFEFPDAEPIEGAVSQSIVKKERTSLQAFSFESLKNKSVEVWARGFRYRGVLSGADEKDLYIKGLTRWWVIPLADISRLEEI